MAFGTFFKKIISGAKNLVQNVAPVVRKGLDAVNKYAPIIADAANKFGGPIGTTIGGIASTAGAIAGKAGKYMDKTGLSDGRFDLPILKSGSG